MTLRTIARILLALFCALEGISTAALDFNRTHASNPLWVGHARFHVVWQTATVLALSIVEIVLIWAHGPLEEPRFYLVAVLALVPAIGFFTAVIARRAYGGTLFDPNGIRPLRLRLHGKEVFVELNLVAEIAGLIFVCGIVALYRFSG